LTRKVRNLLCFRAPLHWIHTKKNFLIIVPLMKSMNISLWRKTYFGTHPHQSPKPLRYGFFVWKIISCHRLESRISCRPRTFNEIKKSTSILVFSVNSICQVAISEYLDVVSVDEIGSLYQRKGITSENYWQVDLELLPCEGTYFQVALRRYSNENDVDFCKRLITEYGVAAIPISSFYENGKTFI
jgi:aspartate/methionine/tyrosine aminotransferase